MTENCKNCKHLKIIDDKPNCPAVQDETIMPSTLVFKVRTGAKPFGCVHYEEKEK